MMTATPALKRPAEIKAIYLKLIDEHLDALLHGRVTEMQEIEDFADQLHIHPTHLSNTRYHPETIPCTIAGRSRNRNTEIMTILIAGGLVILSYKNGSYGF